MENINEYIKNIDELKISLKNTNIKDKINIDDVNNLILTFEKSKPIPIMFYNKNLIEIKNLKNKCIYCERIGQYKYEEFIYCWIHAHTLNN